LTTLRTFKGEYSVLVNIDVSSKWREAHKAKIMYEVMEQLEDQVRADVIKFLEVDNDDNSN